MQSAHHAICTICRIDVDKALKGPGRPEEKREEFFSMVLDKDCMLE